MSSTGSRWSDADAYAASFAGLVAHHSGARFVAQVRGLSHLLRPFADRKYWTGPLPDALTWADQTTGPDGQRVTLDERLTEMLTRHGRDSPNARSNPLRAPALRQAVQATETRLAANRAERLSSAPETSAGCTKTAQSTENGVFQGLS